VESGLGVEVGVVVEVEVGLEGEDEVVDSVFAVGNWRARGGSGGCN